MVDRVFTNCEVRPRPGDGETARAVAVTGDRITAVGDPEAVAPASAERVDCGGGVLLPGFVDAHTHLDVVGRREAEADLGGADGPADCVDRLLAADDGDGWMLGFGYDEGEWGGRRLRASDLDEASADRPVAAFREDLHTVSVNHAALDRLDLPASSVESEDGAPTGVLVEDAAEAVFDAVAPDRERTREYLLAAQDVALAEGVTAVHDMVRRSHAPRVYRDLDLAGDLALRVRLNYWRDHLDAVREVGLATNHGSERVEVGAIKTFVDGAIGSSTARLREPYSDAADEDAVGAWRLPPDELRELVAEVSEAGLQLSAHAIGDAAIETVLEAVAAVGEGESANARHRVEHAEVLTGDLVERLGASALVVSAQPNFHRWAGPGGLYADRLGERRVETNRFRDLLDAGATLAFGSDCMPLGPLYGVEHAVTAPTPGQRLTVGEAIRAYTHGGAVAGFDEHRLGTVETGKLADFAVLAASPWTVAADAVADVDVTMTVSGGEVVFDARR
ncbi:amidohydrolase [Haloarcula sp. JP-L23]|uniref:amidohydrolase n=1 Tax=Haloarcula sp. JP-L23 TaxID=2716717 RepID=UPI00140E96C0|nr:amidohydrolase [Haloarcula sp. JP-L23]